MLKYAQKKRWGKNTKKQRESAGYRRGIMDYSQTVHRVPYTKWSVCPFVGNGSPRPPSCKRVCPFLGPKGGKSNTPWGVRGWRDPVRTGKESLTLCIPCAGHGVCILLNTKVAVTVSEGHTVTHAQLQSLPSQPSIFHWPTHTQSHKLIIWEYY